MFSGTTQEVQVKAIDMQTNKEIKNVKINISGENVQFIKDSNSYEVSRANNKLNITLSHPEYRVEKEVISPSDNALVYLNDLISLGCILGPILQYQKITGLGASLGIIAGFGVVSIGGRLTDISTGAAYKYPETITVYMHKKK